MFNICRILCRSLQERNTELIGKFLCHAVFYHLLAGKITLVPYQQLVDALRGVSVYLLQPLLNIRKSVVISNVIHHDDTVSASVVRGRDGAESFLTCSIPNLQLDGLAFEFNSSDLKVNTNSADITLCVRVVCETEEKTRLSDTRVADEEKLEKIVVFAQTVTFSLLRQYRHSFGRIADLHLGLESLLLAQVLLLCGRVKHLLLVLLGIRRW